LKRKKDRRRPLDLTNYAKLSTGQIASKGLTNCLLSNAGLSERKLLATPNKPILIRVPIKLEIRYPIQIKKVGRKRKADKFLSLPVVVQNQAVVATEIIERLLNDVVDRKALNIRFDWWQTILQRPEKVQNAILHEIGNCLAFCSSKKTDIETYVMFAARVAKKAQISAPGKCLNDPSIRSAFVRLLTRDCSGDTEKLKAVLTFYDYFQKKQVEINGAVTQPFVSLETKYRVKRCTAFEMIAETVDYCADEDIGYLWYIDFKVEQYMAAFDKPNSPFTLYLKNLTNEHFRPTSKDYAKVTLKAAELQQNPLKEIIQYLGLSPDVQFVDGSIPVGFEMSVEHIGRGGKMSDIVTVNKEGYYYTKTGDRFKGQRHHQLQNLHVLSCTPDNFMEFKGRWWDIRRRTIPANEDDLRSHGLYKDKYT